MKQCWKKEILKNFDQAAKNYNSSAEIQKRISYQLANLCERSSIKNGLWVDLGSGTGLLADSIENLHPNQDVMRVDISKRMLDQHHSQRVKQVWDLNKGLPTFNQQPNLLASSFALHWLNDPHERLKEWFHCVEDGGWIAIALPIKGSFKEWHIAAKQAKVTCTAINFPSTDELLKYIDKGSIRYQKVEVVQQNASKVTSLLKPMVNVGAQSSPHPSMNIKQWRKLSLHWPKSKQNKSVGLTWLIQLLLIQR